MTINVHSKLKLKKGTYKNQHMPELFPFHSGLYHYPNAAASLCKHCY